MQSHPIPQRASRTVDYPAGRQQSGEEDEYEYDDVWPPRQPTSARAYVTRSGQRVIEQGNRRVVFHPEPPP